MKEILYHGSNRKVDKPEYGLGKPNNDYGRILYIGLAGNSSGKQAEAGI